jgi:hypothetical protein
VRNWHCQANVAHALPAHNALGNQLAVLVNGSFTAANSFIFGIVGVNVLNRPEDTLTEQAIAFRLLSTVVNGFRLGNLAM